VKLPAILGDKNMPYKATGFGRDSINESGRVTVFGIMIAVVLVITAIILIFIIKEIQPPKTIPEKENITLKVHVKDDLGKAVNGAGISLDNVFIGRTDINGEYDHSYASDQKGQHHQVKAELADYEPSEISVTFDLKPADIALTLQRITARVTIVTVDSLSRSPLSGVAVKMGDSTAGVTDINGSLMLPAFHLHDNPIFRFAKNKFEPKTQYLYVSGKDTILTITLSASLINKPIIPIVTEQIGIARHNNAKFPVIQDSTPDKPNPSDTIPNDTTSYSDVYTAYNYMLSGNYRQAFDIYRSLTSQSRWVRHSDLWLFEADCAIHTSVDANGDFNEAVLDSALNCLREAERNQNFIKEIYWPALVSLKIGEAWSYKCKMQSLAKTGHHEEYCQQALNYLRRSISQFNEIKFTDSDLYKYAVRRRDEVQNY
jgi:hypothetical protein